MYLKNNLEQSHVCVTSAGTERLQQLGVRRRMSGGTRLENANPLIFQRSGERLLTASEEDEDVADPIDDREIFDILSMFQIYHVA